jgi:hypothetical protein
MRDLKAIIGFYLFVTGVLALSLFSCTPAHGRYQLLDNLAGDVDQLTQEQREATLLKGFLIMEPGKARDTKARWRLFTDEHLQQIVDNTFEAPAMLMHTLDDDVSFGYFENFRVEDGVLVADLRLNPRDTLNEKLADGVRVLYYLMPYRAELSAGLNQFGDGTWFASEVSFVPDGAATGRLLK